MIKTILKKADITRRHFNYLLNADRNATASTAKRLARATNSAKEVWVFGTSRQRKEAVKKFLKDSGASK